MAAVLFASAWSTNSVQTKAKHLLFFATYKNVKIHFWNKKFPNKLKLSKSC